MTDTMIECESLKLLQVDNGTSLDSAFVDQDAIDDLLGLALGIKARNILSEGELAEVCDLAVMILDFFKYPQETAAHFYSNEDIFTDSTSLTDLQLTETRKILAIRAIKE